MIAIDQLREAGAHPVHLPLFRPEREVRDDERNRIARELHDSTSQLLVALQLSLARLRHELAGPDSEQLFLDLNATLDELHREVRSAACAKAEPVVAAGQLPSALREMSSKLRKVSKLDIEFIVKGRYSPMPALIEASLFRIAQEAIANVWRHARAQRVRLSLRLNEKSLSLIIQDDGVGIPVNTTGEGNGLANIKERVEELGGRFRIQRLRAGTRLAVKVDRVRAA